MSSRIRIGVKSSRYLCFTNFVVVAKTLKSAFVYEEIRIIGFPWKPESIKPKEEPSDWQDTGARHVVHDLD